MQLLCFARNYIRRFHSLNSLDQLSATHFIWCVISLLCFFRFFLLIFFRLLPSVLPSALNFANFVLRQIHEFKDKWRQLNIFLCSLALLLLLVSGARHVRAGGARRKHWGWRYPPLFSIPGLFFLDVVFLWKPKKFKNKLNICTAADSPPQ